MKCTHSAAVLSGVTLLRVSKRQTKIYVAHQTGLHGYARPLSYRVCSKHLTVSPVNTQCVMLENLAETQVVARRFYLKISERWICWTVRFTWWQTRRQTDCHTILLKRTSMPPDSSLPCHCFTHTSSPNTAFCTSDNRAITQGSRNSFTIKHQIQNLRNTERIFVPIFRIVS